MALSFGSGVRACAPGSAGPGRDPPTPWRMRSTLTGQTRRNTYAGRNYGAVARRQRNSGLRAPDGISLCEQAVAGARVDLSVPTSCSLDALTRAFSACRGAETRSCLLEEARRAKCSDAPTVRRMRAELQRGLGGTQTATFQSRDQRSHASAAACRGRVRIQIQYDAMRLTAGLEPRFDSTGVALL